MRYALTALAILAAIIWGTWLIVVPRDMIQEKIESSLTDGGISVKAKGLSKGLFYSLGIEALEVSRDGRLVLSVYDLQVLPTWSSLLRLRAGLRYSGELAGGTLRGSASTDGRSHDIMLEARDVQLALTEVYNLTGQRLEGSVEAYMKFSDHVGTGTVKAQQLRALDVMVQGFKVPEDLFHTARGAFNVKGNRLEVTSLALEGEGVYARLSGKLDPVSADLKLEVMPEAPDLEMLMSAAMGKYKASAGHYIIPIKQRF